VNFIFCDVFTLMHAEDMKNILSGRIDDIQITQEFLLSFAVMMKIPMLMILLSRLLRHKPNRILNLTFGVLLAIIQLWSLTVGSSTLHYRFFSFVEIAACIGIVWSAWKWKNVETVIR
jgi:branched-subunit amino acid ABC-type transport system permease component